ncbi:MAG: Fic/DOC family N-terminal domain-containing protein, partial [Planctomycetia bacterium]
MPRPLPPAAPPLVIEKELAERHAAALSAIGRLRVAGAMVPDPGWFLYGFVRKEAVLSSQIEGTQATFRDVATFEATHASQHPADVAEVCNYVDALNRA